MRFKNLKQAVAALGLILGGIVYLEGSENHAYYDGGGVVTICSGATRGVKITDYKTDPQCFSMTKTEAERVAEVVNKAVTVELTPHREAALVWFAYNVGDTAFKTSTLLKKLNAGDTVGACNALVRKNQYGVYSGWVYDNGKVIPGLITRRTTEKEYCLYGLN